MEIIRWTFGEQNNENKGIWQSLDQVALSAGDTVLTDYVRSLHSPVFLQFGFSFMVLNLTAEP